MPQIDHEASCREVVVVFTSRSLGSVPGRALHLPYHCAVLHLGVSRRGSCSMLLVQASTPFLSDVSEDGVFFSQSLSVGKEPLSFPWPWCFYATVTPTGIVAASCIYPVAM